MMASSRMGPFATDASDEAVDFPEDNSGAAEAHGVVEKSLSWGEEDTFDQLETACGTTVNTIEGRGRGNVKLRIAPLRAPAA